MASAFKFRFMCPPSSLLRFFDLPGSFALYYL
jgi:hypothetical protein